MRILFVGAVRFSLACLQRILGLGGEVVGVCTLAPSGARSAFHADFSDLSEIARQHGIAYLYVDDINAPATCAWIEQARPDVIFCFGWSRLVRDRVRGIAPLGVIGFHPAALPRHRGRHPIIWALVLGLTETAATFFFMDEGADSGDILSQRRVPIDAADDAGTLYDKITATALQQIEAFLPQLRDRSYPRVAQDHSVATHWRKRGAGDGVVDWRMAAGSIHNLVRGLARPYVGAHFVYRAVEYKLWQTEVIRSDAIDLEPGRVIRIAAGDPVIKCGVDAIRLVAVAPALRVAVGSYL